MKIPTKMALSTKLIISQVIPLAVLLLLTGVLTLVTRSVKGQRPIESRGVRGFL